MPQGLQVFDAQGRLQIDLSYQVNKVLGQVYVGADPGFVNIPALGGNAFGTFNPTYIPDASSWSDFTTIFVYPSFYRNGNGIGWQWDDAGYGGNKVKIYGYLVYGEY